jgi:hypothetical protein
MYQSKRALSAPVRRNRHKPSPGGIERYRWIGGKNAFQGTVIRKLLRFTSTHVPVYKYQEVGEMECQVQLVCSDHSTFNDSCPDEVGKQLEQSGLVGRVQVSGWFIQQKNSRFLGEGPRDHNPLSLSITE